MEQETNTKKVVVKKIVLIKTVKKRKTNLKTIRWNDDFIISIILYDNDTDIPTINRRLQKMGCNYTVSKCSSQSFLYKIEVNLKSVCKIYKIIKES